MICYFKLILIFDLDHFLDDLPYLCCLLNSLLKERRRERAACRQASRNPSDGKSRGRFPKRRAEKAICTKFGAITVGIMKTRFRDHASSCSSWPLDSLTQPRLTLSLNQPVRRRRQIGQGTYEVKWIVVIKAPVCCAARGTNLCGISPFRKGAEPNHDEEKCFKSDGGWRAGKSNCAAATPPPSIHPVLRLLNASMHHRHHQRHRWCHTLTSPSPTTAPKTKNRFCLRHLLTVAPLLSVRCVASATEYMAPFPSLAV